MKPQDILVQKILQEIESGTAPWRRPWQVFDNQNVSGRVYNGFNRLLLGSAGYSSPYWLTFKQVKDIGGKVKAGEHGWPVVYWNWVNKTIETEDGIEYETFPFIRYYTVFNAEQCENLPEKFTHIELKDNNPIQVAESVVEVYTDKPPIKASQRAYYQPIEDVVYMPNIKVFDRSELYYTTLFHELAHSTGHKNRLDRKLKSGYGTTEYGKEELVAEITAAFLANYCKFDEGAYLKPSASYLNGWLNAIKANPKMLLTAASQAEKAYKYILNERNGND